MSLFFTSVKISVIFLLFSELRIDGSTPKGDVSTSFNICAPAFREQLLKNSEKHRMRAGFAPNATNGGKSINALNRKGPVGRMTELSRRSPEIRSRIVKFIEENVLNDQDSEFISNVSGVKWGIPQPLSFYMSQFNVSRRVVTIYRDKVVGDLCEQGLLKFLDEIANELKSGRGERKPGVREELAILKQRVDSRSTVDSAGSLPTFSHLIEMIKLSQKFREKVGEILNDLKLSEIETQVFYGLPGQHTEKEFVSYFSSDTGLSKASVAKIRKSILRQIFSRLVPNPGTEFPFNLSESELNTALSSLKFLDRRWKTILFWDMRTRSKLSAILEQNQIDFRDNEKQILINFSGINTKKKQSIQEIAEQLGLSLSRVTFELQIAFLKIKPNLYLERQTQPSL